MPEEAFIYEYTTITPIIVGLVMILVVMRANFSQPQTASSVLVFFLCVSDLCMILTGHVNVWAALLSGGWIFGKIGCIVDYIVLYTSVMSSISTLTAIAVERYLHICAGIELSNRFLYRVMPLTYLVIIVVSMIPWMVGQADESIQMISTGYYCNLAFYSRNIVAILLNAFTITWFFVCTNIMAYCYFRIFMVFREATSKKKSKDAHAKQVLVLQKCIVLTLAFCIMWSIEVAAVFYEIISGLPASVTFHGLGGAMSLTHACMNPFLLMYFDSSLNQTVKQYLAPFGSAYSSRSNLSGTAKGDISNIESFQQNTHSALPQTVILT